MAIPASPSATQNQPSRIYAIMWAVAALGAAAYIGTLLYKPELIGGTVKHPVSDQESNKGVRSLSSAIARLEQLRKSVRSLENEITRLKAIDSVAAKNTAKRTPPVSVRKLNSKPVPAGSVPQNKARLKTKVPKTAATPLTPGPVKPINVASAGKSARELAARFSDAADQNGKRPAPKTLASTAATTTTTPALHGVKIISKKVAPSGNTPGQVIGNAVQNAKPNIVTTKSVKTVPIKIANVKTKNVIKAPRVDAFGKTAKIQTGSVRPPPAIKFGAPVVKRAKPRAKVAIRLASGPSIAALRLNWLALKDRYGDALRGMRPRYETLGAPGNRRYRLIAGPLNSAAHAVSLCDHLNASNIDCTVSALSGKRL